MCTEYWTLQFDYKCPLDAWLTMRTFRDYFR
jgi:hypothetical protein